MKSIKKLPGLVSMILGCLCFLTCGSDEMPDPGSMTILINEDINEATTWTNHNDNSDEADYCIRNSIDVKALLTVEPGTRIEFATGTELIISYQGGALVANGTGAEPIVFTGKTATNGFWKGILFESDDVRNSLNNCTISYAGSGAFGSIFMADEKAGVALGISNSAGIAGRISMTNCTIEESGGMGLYLRGGSLINFSSNTFTQNKEAAVRIPPSAIFQMDASSVFNSSNGINAVEVTEGKIEESTEITIQKLSNNTPFHIIESISLLSGVSVAPGTTLKFGAGVELIVDYRGGYLIAEGNASEIITFDGIEALQGFWDGILFESEGMQNKLSFCTVANGGGGAFNSVFIADQKANIVLGYSFSADIGGYLVLDNSTIRDSDECGIFAEDNTFLETTNVSYSNNNSGNECM